MWDDDVGRWFHRRSRGGVLRQSLFSHCHSGSTGKSLFPRFDAPPSISIFDFNDSITAAGAAVEIRMRQFLILRLFALSLFIVKWYNISVNEEALICL